MSPKYSVVLRRSDRQSDHRWCALMAGLCLSRCQMNLPTASRFIPVEAASVVHDRIESGATSMKRLQMYVAIFLASMIRDRP